MFLSILYGLNGCNICKIIDIIIDDGLLDIK